MHPSLGMRICVPRRVILNAGATAELRLRAPRRLRFGLLAARGRLLREAPGGLAVRHLGIECDLKMPQW